ncbi:hypothetical protein D3C78_1545060 [compost metagenome]
MVVSEQSWVLELLGLLLEHGGSWRVWVGLAVCVLASVVWKAKKFRLLIELSTDDHRNRDE